MIEHTVLGKDNPDCNPNIEHTPMRLLLNTRHQRQTDGRMDGPAGLSRTQPDSAELSRTQSHLQRATDSNNLFSLRTRIFADLLHPMCKKITIIKKIIIKKNRAYPLNGILYATLKIPHQKIDFRYSHISNTSQRGILFFIIVPNSVTFEYIYLRSYPRRRRKHSLLLYVDITKSVFFAFLKTRLFGLHLITW